MWLSAVTVFVKGFGDHAVEVGFHFNIVVVFV